MLDINETYWRSDNVSPVVQYFSYDVLQFDICKCIKSKKGSNEEKEKKNEI